jgi:hypothetical protein
MALQKHIDVLSAIVKQDYPTLHNLLAAGTLDIVSFESFLSQNQVSGYVYSALVDMRAVELFPSPVIARLKSSYAKQQQRNRKFLVEVKQLLSRFSAARQEFILLKGLYLAQRFYGDIDRRALWDIDILVKREALQDAQDLLADCGYKRKSHIFMHEGLSCYFTHAFDFAKSGASLDLHWALSSHLSYRLNYATLWARRQPFYIEDNRFFVLPDEYEVVFNLLASLRDLERGALRVRSLVDLYMILKTVGPTLDWHQFFIERRRENVWKICLTMLSLLLSTFQCHAEFPELARAVEHEREMLQVRNEQTLAELLQPSPLGIRNKLTASQLYQTTLIAFLFWWTVSLPFRLCVYRPGRFSRLKNTLAGYFLKNVRSA